MFVFERHACDGIGVVVTENCIQWDLYFPEYIGVCSLIKQWQ